MPTTTVTKRSFGTSSDGRAVTAYTLTNATGASVTALDYGCIIQSLIMPDRDGKLADIVLGYDDIAGYENNGGYLGAAIGRVGNRIGGAEFVLNGKLYKLFANDGKNHLHGGKIGFNQKLWDVNAYGNRIIFTALSPDGDEGYPGTLRLKLVYTLTDCNKLSLEYFAQTDADTIINLTNHSYFNLCGHDNGSILNHEIAIHADCITAADCESIPHGELMDVSGTPFDLRQPKRIGDGIDANHQQLIWGGGYDHNFVLGKDKETKCCAEVYAPCSGRVMTVYTDKPGVQFYSGNFLEGQSGKSGAKYNKRAGLCLETQYYPNTMACREFPSCVLHPNMLYHYTTVYAFGVR